MLGDNWKYEPGKTLIYTCVHIYVNNDQREWAYLIYAPTLIHLKGGSIKCREGSNPLKRKPILKS